MYSSDPAGDAAEVVNCRCALLQRARWAFGDNELKALQDRAAYYNLDKTQNFEDFKQKYLKATQSGTSSNNAKFLTTAKSFSDIENYMKTSYNIVLENTVNSLILVL